MIGRGCPPVTQGVCHRAVRLSMPAVRCSVYISPHEVRSTVACLQMAHTLPWYALWFPLFRFPLFSSLSPVPAHRAAVVRSPWPQSSRARSPSTNATNAGLSATYNIGTTSKLIREYKALCY